MADSSTHIVKSAQRVLQVIEFFDQDRPAASVSEISRALSYPQSSTSVLLRCLRQLGYLYYDRYNRTYRLTTRAALLGCWAEKGNYRGGRVLDMLDAVAARTSETVVLSVANVDYALHHLHVAKGTSADRVDVPTGSASPMLNNVQGELQLASYPDANVRLALHRLNAEEPDPDKRVAIADKLAEFRLARERGWSIGAHYGCEGASAVAALVPRHRGGDRVILSIVATNEVIERKGGDFLRILLHEREQHFGLQQAEDTLRPDGSAYDRRTLVNSATAQNFAIGKDAN